MIVKVIEKLPVKIALYILTALLLSAGALLCVVPAKAFVAISRSITISNSEASATDVSYRLSFSTDPSTPAYNIGGIVVEFCDDSAIVGDIVCTTPPGFNLNLASLAISNQSGVTGFSIHANSDTNTLILTKAPTTLVAPNTAVSFSLGSNGANDGITNPNLGNHSFYARILTYTSAADAANYLSGSPGSYIDSGGFALSTANRVDINTIVPPYLFFCAAQAISGYDCTSASELYVNFGNFSPSYTSTGLSQLLILTNAGSGYGVRIYGTTLTSGNNTIKAIVPQHASNTGIEQFGLNLVANTNPAIGNDPVGPGSAVPMADYATANRFKFNSGDTIISGSGVTTWRKFTISYIVNINQNQRPGIYTTTLTFICLANF